MPTSLKSAFEQPSFPKTEKRLLGTWKSDKRRTFAEWSWAKKLTPKKKEWFKSIFGKLEINYGRTKVISRLRHRRWEQSRRYVVLGSDENSVAIVNFGRLEIKNRRKYSPLGLEIVDELHSKPEIKHIHFDKKHFWVLIGNGKNRQFFRKLRNKE